MFDKNRIIAESLDQFPEKQTLGSLNPGTLGPFLPANWEKIQIYIDIPQPPGRISCSPTIIAALPVLIKWHHISPIY